VIRGREITVFPSLTDVPTAIRGDLDKENSSLKLEFRYLGERQEPLVISCNVPDNLTASVGKHSGRIYQVSLNAKALPIPNASGAEYSQIADALAKRLVEELHKTTKSERLIESYELAGEVITEQGANILETAS
jgi:hypothetical protein